MGYTVKQGVRRQDSVRREIEYLKGRVGSLAEIEPDLGEVPGVKAALIEIDRIGAYLGAVIARRTEKA